MIISNLVKKISIPVLVLCLLGFVSINGCRKSSPNPSEKSKEETVKPAISKSLEEIISRRTGWNPILDSFYGKVMPDFSVTDIDGKKHKLSEYRGKNVMVVFWATWCMPCMEEVPHLVALRDIMSKDKLAILAISSEPEDAVKATAQNREMTYTVISHQGVLPKPFSSIRGYPSTFFIRPDGTLKLVVEGASQLGEMKSIILAE